jgi:hypothetical protein
MNSTSTEAFRSTSVHNHVLATGYALGNREMEPAAPVARNIGRFGRQVTLKKATSFRSETDRAAIRVATNLLFPG